MAAINFPDSPSNGDTHTVGGVTYTYNSAETKWKTTINSNAFLPLSGGTVSGNILMGGEIQHDGDTDTNISFGTDEILFDTAGSERFRVGSAGQLGIGGATYGTDGQVLTSTGATTAPAWEDLPAAGFTRSSQSTLSGNSSVDFSIASGVDYVDVIGYNFSSSADAEIRLQLGDSGGIKTSGYRSGTSLVYNSGSTEIHSSSSGFVLATGEDVRTYECHWRLRRMGNGAWSCTWNGMFNGSGNTLEGTMQGGGHYSPTLSGGLTTVRLTVASGTFDDGSASVLYL